MSVRDQRLVMLLALALIPLLAVAALAWFTR
jgi:hypothetical protein